MHIGILNKEIIFDYECLWYKNTIDYADYPDYRLLRLSLMHHYNLSHLETETGIS